MSTKTRIIEALGEPGLLLPDLISEGLAANDRIKYYLTLLQTANAQALHPLDPAPNLRDARESSGVSDASMDDVVAGSRKISDDLVLIPESDRLRQKLFDDLRLMIEPLRAAASVDADAGARFDAYNRRLNTHLATLPSWADDHVEPRALDAFTGAGDETHDTVHRLVMDLHRELNRLLAGTAVESIDGARAGGLIAADRPLVRAFMKGVNATAALKFDHPGLGTTAVRYGGKLSIQNDLGTTEGHLVIVRVDDSTATVIYSDVHRKRVRFLQSLLEPTAIEWQPASAAERGELEMIVGHRPVAGANDLMEFLRFLGSRLVFLIDWNRARKRLGRFVKKSDAVALLRWAADNNIGHRGFLQAGGIELIYTAFERIAPSRIRYGVRLDELIGRDAAIAFLKAVLRISAAGLEQRQSARLIQDEVEAELLSHLQSAERQILETASEHAMLMSALAERLRATLARAAGAHWREDFARTAALAKTWETRADEIVRNASRILDRDNDGCALRPLLREADDVADALEESAFLLTLLPDTARGIATLRGLADLVSEATREYIRALEHVKEVSRDQPPSSVDDVLVCVDRIAELEHASDAAERASKATLLNVCADFRELQVISDIARGFEQASDALARCARTIRDYALSSASGPS